MYEVLTFINILNISQYSFPNVIAVCLTFYVDSLD
jgi:hypothetical protein